MGTRKKSKTATAAQALGTGSASSGVEGSSLSMQDVQATGAPAVITDTSISTGIPASPGVVGTANTTSSAGTTATTTTTSTPVSGSGMPDVATTSTTTTNQSDAAKQASSAIDGTTTENQSEAAGKASSGPKGTKRRLTVPGWEIGELYKHDDYESYMRPPPHVNHKHVVYASFKQAASLPDVSDVIKAAALQFGTDLVAADVFPASQQIALAFTSAKAAAAAAATGLVDNGEVWQVLTHRAPHRPRLEKITVSDVDTTDPIKACMALGEYFSHYGTVIEVAPRYWEDTSVHTGTWHVTIDAAAEFAGKITVMPPEIATIGGVEVIVDLPQIRRVCRVCRSSEHANPACRVGQALARQGKQRQRQEQQQDQQRQKEITSPVKSWAAVAASPAPRPGTAAPPPAKTTPKGKGKGKTKAGFPAKPTPTTTTPPAPKQDLPKTDPPKTTETMEIEESTPSSRSTTTTSADTGAVDGSATDRGDDDPNRPLTPPAATQGSSAHLGHPPFPLGVTNLLYTPPSGSSDWNLYQLRKGTGNPSPDEVYPQHRSS